MGERFSQGTSGCDREIKDAVCVHTDKVYDSCKDKDCIEDARVFLTASGQEIIDNAVNVKCRKAEIIWVFPDVELCKPNFYPSHCIITINYYNHLTLHQTL